MWLTVFFGAGTILWSETIYGNTWSMPETCSLMFTLAALDEAFGPARPLRLGIFAGLAALARYELAIAGATYAILAMRRGRRIRDLLLMIPGFALSASYSSASTRRATEAFSIKGMLLIGPKDGAFGLRYLLGNIATLFSWRRHRRQIPLLSSDLARLCAHLHQSRLRARVEGEPDAKGSRS